MPKSVKFVNATPKALRYAAHEAGHGVYADCFGIEITGIWINPLAKQNELVGAVSHKPIDASSVSARVVSAGLMCAGLMAEILFLGSANFGISTQDFRDLADLYSVTYDPSCAEGADDVNKIISMVRPIVETVLTVHHLAVVRLVRALVKTNRFTGAEAIRIIRRGGIRCERIPQSIWLHGAK